MRATPRWRQVVHDFSQDLNVGELVTITASAKQEELPREVLVDQLKLPHE